MATTNVGLLGPLSIAKLLSGLNSSASGDQQQQRMAQQDAVAAAAAFLLAINAATAQGIAATRSTEGREAEVGAGGGTADPSLPDAVPEQPTDLSLSSTSPKGGGNQWIHLGTFGDEAQMHEVRNKEKVSKRRTEQLKNGVKVRYRCNTWKRTKCGFQMFSFQDAATGMIDLYECGEHDHSGRRKLEYDLLGPLARRKATPLPIINALKNVPHKGGSAAPEKALAKRAPTTPETEESGASTSFASPAKARKKASSDAAPAKHTEQREHPFSVCAEPEKLQELAVIATEFGLGLQQSGSAELSICKPTDGNKSTAPRALLLIAESTDGLTLAPCSDRFPDGSRQRWLKADWLQFVWAFRGLCAHLSAKI